MKSYNGAIVLDDIERFCPSRSYIEYTDTTGIVIRIPSRVLIRLYEGMRYDIEEHGGNFTEYCKKTMLDIDE